jgi:hypothetical protein
MKICEIVSRNVGPQCLTELDNISYRLLLRIRNNSGDKKEDLIAAIDDCETWFSLLHLCDADYSHITERLARCKKLIDRMQ